jgi:hypothetical protein
VENLKIWFFLLHLKKAKDSLVVCEVDFTDGSITIKGTFNAQKNGEIELAIKKHAPQSGRKGIFTPCVLLQ